MNATGEHLRDTPIGQRSAGYSRREAIVETTVAGSDDHAISWSAILAGAAAAASLTLLLVILGMGLGLSSVSPWAYDGVSAETFGWSAIGWISFTAFAASALGGYLAGRLRTRWSLADRDESFFRDTAHGFLAWAVATLLTATLLASTIATIVGAGAKAGSSLAGAAAGTVATAGAGMAAAGLGALSTDEAGGTLDYWVDTLFRPSADAAATPGTQAASNPADAASQDDAAAATTSSAATSSILSGAAPDPARAQADPQASRAEVARIFVNSLGDDALADDDARYVAQLIANRTGMSQQEAQSRVTEAHARMVGTLDKAETTAREAADAAREATAYASLWLVITLLLGAFSASLFATFGGRQRDA